MEWRKSSFSGTETACVEVAYSAAIAASGVSIRDSKDLAAQQLVMPETAFQCLNRVCNTLSRETRSRL
jgi:Domain of unknown function (DUF397)